MRAAHSRAATPAADFSRIRNAALRRLTVDDLMPILNRLGSRVEVRVRVRRTDSAAARPLGRPVCSVNLGTGKLIRGSLSGRQRLL